MWVWGTGTSAGSCRIEGSGRKRDEDELKGWELCRTGDLWDGRSQTTPGFPQDEKLGWDRWVRMGTKIRSPCWTGDPTRGVGARNLYRREHERDV